MVTPELISYIVSERNKGTPEPLIRTNLISQGWSAADYDEAVQTINSGGKLSSAQKAKIGVSPELKKYRRDRKWFIFAVTALLALVSLFWMFGLQISLSTFFSGAWTFVFSALVATYISSYIISGMMQPRSSGLLEFIYVFFSIILTIILSYIIGFGVLFVTCIFASTTGLMRSGL